MECRGLNWITMATEAPKLPGTLLRITQIQIDHVELFQIITGGRSQRQWIHTHATVLQKEWLTSAISQETISSISRIFHSKLYLTGSYLKALPSLGSSSEISSGAKGMRQWSSKNCWSTLKKWPREETDKHQCRNAPRIKAFNLHHAGYRHLSHTNATLWTSRCILHYTNAINLQRLRQNGRRT